MSAEPTLHEALAARGYRSEPTSFGNGYSRTIIEGATGRVVGRFKAHEAWLALHDGTLPDLTPPAPRHDPDEQIPFDIPPPAHLGAARSRVGAKAKLLGLLLDGKALEAVEFWSVSGLARADYFEANEHAARAVLEGLRGAA